MNEELKAGQVWEWSLGNLYDIHGGINEIYLLLHPVTGYFTSAHLVPVDNFAWQALNLETGQLELITPLQTAGEWILHD